jgi:hypothetical protein
VNSKYMKASQWFKSRDEILAAEKNDTLSLCQNKFEIRRVVRLKTKNGRGRKIPPWVLWLHAELCSEFDRVRTAGVKFSPQLLKNLALDVVKGSTHPEFNPFFEWQNIVIKDKIAPRWIQSFMKKQNIVGRAQTGKLMLSSERQTHLEMEIDHHLGMVGREFQSGLIDEEMVENWDETHFVTNMVNGKSLRFRGENDVKYADFMSGRMGMRMVVRLTGGPYAEICTPLMLFQNQQCSYPINGVPDNVLGVCYRNSKKGFMTRKVLEEAMGEKRFHYVRMQNGRQRQIRVENFWRSSSE